MRKTITDSNPSMLRDRIRGCLLGVAVGDALGAPFEHIMPGESNQALDMAGGRIEDFNPFGRYPAGSWTDDTGMTLATCRAFIEAETTGRGMEACFRDAFEAWSVSQECRKPGKTLLHAARFGEPDVNSWANGALMRIAPVALYSHLTELNRYETSMLAYRIARLTHGHPMATFPAVSCVEALSSILHGEESVPGFAGSGLGCGEAVLNDPASRMVHYTREYELKHEGPIKDLPATTGLWMWRHVMENCLGLKPGSLMPTRKTLYWSMLPEFEDGILHTVNSSFDRDTAGAVAGAILGTYWGESGIPDRWKNMVEKADMIRDLADRLIEVCRPRRSGQPSDAAKTMKHHDRGPEPVNLLMEDVATVEFEGRIYVNANPPDTLKTQYEAVHGADAPPGWEPLAWEERYTMKRGDVLRGYVRPFRVPEEIFFKEFHIKSAPYVKTCAHYRARGRKSEMVDLYGNSSCTTYSIFDHAEVWVKRGPKTR